MRIAQTERLVLRTLTPEDAPFYLELLNQPSFHQNIGDRQVRTLEQALAHMEQGPFAMQAARGHSLYHVALNDGTPIGLCGLIKRDTLDDVDIGYAYLERHFGQGYAYEAATAVLHHATRALGLTRILAITNPGNEASIGLLLKCGFVFQRFVHMPPDEKPTNIYLFQLHATG